MAKAVAESMPYLGRAPRGARGLKYVAFLFAGLLCNRSCPSRGTWIEIGYAHRLGGCDLESCPSRGTWIEIGHTFDSRREAESRAPRGARGLKYGAKGRRIPPWLVVPLAGH